MAITKKTLSAKKTAMSSATPKTGKKKWIQAMNMKKGALHKELGVPEGKKIPKKTLTKASAKKGMLGKRANLAKTLISFKK